MSTKKVVSAWVVQGRCPSYHEQHKQWLKSNWPTLYYSLEDLTQEYFEDERN